MTESFRDSGSHEKDRTGNGLVEVAFDDGDTVLLHGATIRESSHMIEEKRVHYEVLSNYEGYELYPYTIFNDPDVLEFGNELQSTLPLEGYLALHSKRHATALGFLAIAERLADGDQLRRLENDVHQKFREDSNDYPLDLNILVNQESYDLWVRLEFRSELDRRSKGVIMAKLAFISAGKDKITMIPYIDSFDGSQKAPIPEQLQFGHPWLYVGGEYYKGL